jgi:hypothetical protein
MATLPPTRAALAIAVAIADQMRMTRSESSTGLQYGSPSVHPSNASAAASLWRRTHVEDNERHKPAVESLTNPL